MYFKKYREIITKKFQLKEKLFVFFKNVTENGYW